MASRVEWYGDQLKARMHVARTLAAGDVADNAIGEAGPMTPVDTGRARNSLAVERRGTAAIWGYHVGYGIWIEIGARGRAGVHALRRAADRTYGRLSGRIAARFG